MAEDEPNTFLIVSLVALFCFWPLGLPALICACKTRSYNKARDYDKAAKTSIATLYLSITAVILAVVPFFILGAMSLRRYLTYTT